jgi:metallo-beta-lactamase family protein
VVKLRLQFLGAAREVTGSLYLLSTPRHTLLLECGLLQGAGDTEDRNSEPFPFAPGEIDAVVLSHAHIDHSGRIPLLVKRGYRGPIYAHHATEALCRIMLPDSGYLNEKDAEWENRRRRERGRPVIEPIYTLAEAKASIGQFESIGYDKDTEILPGIWLRLRDAGHILGSSIVEIRCVDGEESKTLVFSGDLGYRDTPVMDDPRRVRDADIVVLESTYGDRMHKPFADTLQELGEVFEQARAAQGNILIPALTVGRTQDPLYLLAEPYDEWHLRHWHIFLDSPMGIEATEVYARYRHLYGARLFGPESSLPGLPNYHATRTSEESMAINRISSGAIILAGSGMCTGGRILHHLKNNVWRPACHVVIVGYQAIGTLGRRLVDGADDIRLWGETYPVRASVHTIGGLSAHADQADLVDWYGGFGDSPPVYLVHGEPEAQTALRARLKADFDAPVNIASYGQVVEF